MTPSILENCGRIFADAPAIFLREASAVKLIAQPSRDRITRRNVPIARRYWEAAALNFSVTSVPNRINGQPIRKPVFAARRIARRARKQTLCSGHQRLEKTMKRLLVASVFVLSLTGMAIAKQEGIPNPYFVAIHNDSGACVIMNKTPDAKYFKTMGTYDSMEAAHKAMGGMKECG